MRPLLVAALLVPVAASAQPYDPAYHWHTIETPHFEIHYHQGEDALVRRVAGAAERAWAKLVPAIQYEPAGRVQVVLSDDTDSANGMATVLPYNTIRLYAVPPPGRSELNDYRDWVESLVDHELTHIFQLDQVAGFPAFLNQVFGRIFFPNGLLPEWTVEGFAVLHESGGDPATGRNASALFDMYARSLVMEPPGLPSLNLTTHPSLDWPAGQLPYLLGGKFFEMVQRRGSDQAIALFFGDQARRIWPWAPSPSAYRAFGRELPEIWEDLRVHLGERYARQLAEVRARPVTAAAQLTHRGALIANPRWAPDGRTVAWLDRSLDERAGIRRATLDGRDLGLATPVDLTGSFALRTPTEAIASIGEIWREFRYYEDLWRVDLATGSRHRLTDGERATDPDVLPGGDEIVYVARSVGGEMELRKRRLSGGGVETLLSIPGAQLFSPRLSPDGARIAFELHEGGRRDIAVLEAGKVTRVTDDDALDLHPVWSPDGRWLFFASDRGGIFNLYARGTDGVVRQVTNVESGALEPEPSPDGKTLAFVGYSRAGYDLATMPLDPSGWIDPLPAPATRPFAPPEDPPVSESRPYSPFATLYPRWWLPYLSTDAAGNTYGAQTGGVDVLGLHTWGLLGWYSAGTKGAGYYAAYQGGWSWPLLDAWSSRDVVVSPGLPLRDEVQWTPISPGATFTFTTVTSIALARLGWIGTSYESLGAPSTAPVIAAQRFRDGFLSAASLTLAWTNGRHFRRSISNEEGGFALADLQLAEPWMATDYDLARAHGAIGGYVHLPWSHWVLAGRLAGGAARGSLGGRAPFRLGGLELTESGGATTTIFAIGGSDQLRGYRPESVYGNGFVLGNAEIRFPLFRPELGRTTWPIFLRRLHGALFVDAGDAFDVGGTPSVGGHSLALDTIRFGVGGELRLELFLGYYLPVVLRCGVAAGLGPIFAAHPGSDPAKTLQAYITAGPAF